MKKFPGRLDSFRLLYVKSRTSRTAKAPKPRGNESKRFILNRFMFINKILNVLFQKKKKSTKTYPTFKIRNFGIEERETGSSSIWLLNKFNISNWVKFAIPGGTSENYDYVNK